ncbi:uncharacterized protein N7503_008534 [Penicillium pulvis]|uniref:uncharacterized protein n=1 Tax=Penicillium pulvis TaxID=1562058 RepID=UPI0025479BE0|nr:uncharacterized protein N7503_008534 [Penicillium pulvis]KAJ5792556.1 hypothetical protein N7503_008534 [Penicillium pulvis]
MFFQSYLKVPNPGPAEDEEYGVDVEDKLINGDSNEVSIITTKKNRLRVPMILSILINVFLLGILLFRLESPPPLYRSKYAGLARTVPRPWGLNAAINDTEQDALWDATSYDLGNIALSDTYARSNGLPRAQRFPWDNEKGIYLINAYHNLHCVKTMRTALVEFRDGRPQSSPFGHLEHCLLVLRDEAMCNADDTPRYTGFQPNQKSGLGQVRMCRDFEQLEQWARDHTACWRHVGEIREEGFRELDRYRFCPDGSPYKEMSETMYLKGDWWKQYKNDGL